MGLLMPGVVRCNCFVHGLTAPPPFPSDWVVAHNGDWDLATPLRDDDSAEAAFRAWARSCCGHRSMWAAEVWPRLAALLGLLDTLSQIDADWARAIMSVLPRPNHGVVTVPAAALAGLERFGVARPTLKERMWIDRETGESVGYAVDESGWRNGDQTVSQPQGSGRRQIEDRPLAADGFESVLNDLRALFVAAAQTDNPIVWDVGQERAPQWRR